MCSWIASVRLTFPISTVVSPTLLSSPNARLALGLGIGFDQQDPLAGLAVGDREIHRGRGLPLGCGRRRDHEDLYLRINLDELKICPEYPVRLHAWSLQIQVVIEVPHLRSRVVRHVAEERARWPW